VKSGQLVIAPEDEADSRSALHLYPVQVQPASGRTRREVYDTMRQSGIGVNVHYLPIYWHPYYRKLGFERGHCPRAETYYERAISLPMHPGLDAGQLDRVVQALRDALA
jgi:perosamine synthetase